MGTGLGPSLEFYTLVCKEMQVQALGMWRSDGGDEQVHVNAVNGLFPAPRDWSSETEEGTKILRLFTGLGRLVGKALMDGRLIDLPFSRTMYKVLMGRELVAEDIGEFDPVFFRSLQPLIRVADAVAAGADPESVTMDETGARVEDLFLSFVLVGEHGFELVPSGGDKAVTSANVGEYVAAVVDATLLSGVKPQLDAMMAGMGEVLDVHALRTFGEDELEIILMGQDEPWTEAELASCCVVENGYEVHSRVIRDLFSVLASFTEQERREFLMFMTGSPRLPYGGWGALDPPFKIVRKSASEPDAYMPSTMTCLNFLKLPEYSSGEVLRAKLIQAMREGGEGFLLS